MAQEDEDAALGAANVLAALASHSPPLPQSSGHHDALPFSNPYQITPGTPDGREASVAQSDSLQPQTPTAHKASADGDTDMDEETAKTIAAMGSEYNTRVRVKGPSTYTDMVPTPDLNALEMTQRLTSRKRSAPKSSLSAGVKKPAAKKRKSDVLNDRGTPTSSRHSPTPPSTSVPPASRPSGPTKKPKSMKKTNPRNSPGSPSAGSDASEASDAALYCICRKPDDHTWMIGCDGPCGDWFHGKCVDMQKENQALVDKYICPNCVAGGHGVTTWKPMCRAGGCRKPAILKKGKESKYCSKECGIKFMKASIARAAGQLDGGPVKRSRGSATDANQRDHLPRVGGTLQVGELKALADHVGGFEEFRRLGSGMLFPSFGPSNGSSANAEDPASDIKIDFMPPELERLAAISSRKSELRQKRLLLKDRGAFVAMMRSRVPKIAERLKKKERDVCGFDPLWSLDDPSFAAWRDSAEGKAVFESGVLELPADLGDVTVNNKEDTDATPVLETSQGICLRKSKCNRHGNAWSKLVLDDVRFESSQVATEMRQIDAEEKEVRRRALKRMGEKEKASDKSMDGSVEEVERGDDDADDDQARSVGNASAKNEIKIEEDVRPAYVAGGSSPMNLSNDAWS